MNQKKPLLPTRRREIVAECERLSLDYAHYADARRMDDWAELFAEDAEMHVFGRVHAGRAAIRRFAGAGSEKISVHAVSNLRIDVLSADEAEGSAYLTVFTADQGEGPGRTPVLAPLLVGIYRDRYRRTVAGWKFARRVFEPLIVSGAS